MKKIICFSSFLLLLLLPMLLSAQLPSGVNRPTGPGKTSLNEGAINDIHKKNDQLNNQTLSLHISPNPFSTQANIRLNADMENATLRLFSVDGKLLQVKTNLNIGENENLPLDTDHLRKGTYFLQIQNKSEMVMTKLIKS